MPVAVSYPGVYVQELPSSVHTIVGVPTSIAAFVGDAPRGPIDQAVQVSSWSAYERNFGSLDVNYPMSQSVYAFFLNGGATAEVVRAGANDDTAVAARYALSADTSVVAASPGTWGNNLSITVDFDGISNKTAFLNLTVSEMSLNGQLTLATERFGALSLANLPAALNASRLISSDPDPKNTHQTMPVAGTYTLDGVIPAPDPAAAPAAPPIAPEPDAPGGAAPVAGAAAVAAKPVGGKDLPTRKGADTPPGQLAVPGDQNKLTGIYALNKVDIFNMLCLPAATTSTYVSKDLDAVAKYCTDHRAMLIVDPPSTWSTDPLTFQTVVGNPALTASTNAAVYYPNLVITDNAGVSRSFGPSGAVAGVWAGTDSARGVWKAPAGAGAQILGITDLAAHIDDAESGVLNPIAVNALRTLPLVGPVIWGARTTSGADEAPDSSWKYLPVRRTALFIEESLRRATQWVVFEPNDEPLWSSIRLNVGVFMTGLFSRGAFQGSTPAEAFFVQCDANNNPQDQIDLGIVNILVGFAPLKPAEFVVISIEQLAGQLGT